ncbi:olfactory receptor OR9H1-like [Pelodiscus sinensis]|uniref:olfactory receptor OR9H1-like n=1 Tax=Pelodiscus sinensis TaxID=13735 RepID=UPI003F6D5EFB
MEKAEGGNGTFFKELILLGFGNGPELQPLLFLLFLVIYLAALAGNLLIVVLVVADRHLHTPMYYFVANLSAVEICSVSTTLPRLLASLATGDRTISLQNCIVQFNIYIILSNTECLLLTAMCIDRCIFPIVEFSFFQSSATADTGKTFMERLRVPVFVIRIMEKAEGGNGTFFKELILLGFGNGPELQPLLFLLFLVIYLAALAGNLLIVVLVVADRQLQTPMYYFVANLSTVEILIDPIFQKVIDVWFFVMVPLLNPILYCLRNKEVHQSLRKARVALVAFRHKPGV